MLLARHRSKTSHPSALPSALRSCPPVRASVNASSEPEGQTRMVCGAEADCGTTIVYLVRHGEALHNLVDSDPDCFAKRRDAALRDPPLTHTGEAQAKSAAAKLQDMLTKHNDGEAAAVVSSTLRRALQTAEVAALPRAAAGAPMIALDMAVEIQYDDIWNEPRSADEVAADWPEWRIEAGGLTSVPEATKMPLLECADAMIARA